MKIMGIDISSKSTGWCVIDNNELVEYGKINPTGSMTHAQKLYLFHIEIDKIINKFQPDEIIIEDVIRVQNTKITKILARFNGVCVMTSYGYLKKDPYLIEPTAWKKMLEGCNGASKKYEIQLAVCKKFNLLSDEKLQEYNSKIEKIFENEDDYKKEISNLRKEINKLKKNKEDDKELKDTLSKKQKDHKKEMNKKFDSLSMEIYVDTGINEDIADSIGAANSFLNGYKRGK